MPEEPKDGRANEEAKSEAESIRKRILEGEDFAKLAKEHSDDPGNASKGGDLGWFKRGRMAKPFEEAAFGLKETGDISGVVETRFGYHIIKLTGSKRGLDYFKEIIENKLAIEKSKESYNDFLGNLREKADVEIYKENLKKINITQSPLNP
jgi:parvulin-like peptidyl-prolyl isomerase